jgi:ParB-like chromosome segregation protein Spo0J
MTTHTNTSATATPEHLEFHPLAVIFPLISGSDFSRLAADIKANGVQEPIVLLNGKILDGRNRYRAALEAGVHCPTRNYTGTGPLAYVISLNLHRRHLNASQRAMVAAKLATMEQGARTDLASIEAMSQPIAAEMLNVGRSAVQRATIVLDSGAPELVKAVEQGGVSVSAAADIAKLPENEQREIVAGGKQEVIRNAKRIRAGKKNSGHQSPRPAAPGPETQDERDLQRLISLYDAASPVVQRGLREHILEHGRGEATEAADRLNETMPQAGPQMSAPCITCEEHDQPQLPPFLDRRPKKTDQNTSSAAMTQQAETACDAAKAPGA